MTDELVCPWCPEDDPETFTDRLDRVLHIFEAHEDEIPIRWDQHLAEVDNR